MDVLVTIVILCACYVAIKLLQLKRMQQRVSHIPGPVGSFLLGNLDIFYQPGKPITSMIANGLNRLSKVYGQYGLFKFQIGPKPTICLINAEGINTILGSSQFVQKSSDYDMVRYWLGSSLSTSDEKEWKRKRKIIQPAFHTPVLMKFLPTFNHHATQLVRAIEDQGIVQDVSLLTINTGMDIVCETAFGVPSNSKSNGETHPYAQSLQRFTEILVLKIFSPWYWNHFIFALTPLGRDMRHHSKVMRDFTMSVIQERMDMLLESYTDPRPPPTPGSSGTPYSKKNQLALLDLLLKFHMEGELTLEEVSDEVNTIAFAGHDTVGISLAFSLLLLSHHPEQMNKLRDELDSMFGFEDTVMIGQEELPHLKYLDGVVKETLRLYPPGPTFGRTVKRDVMVNGFTIPAGTDVWVNLKALHTDANVYPDPMAFRPERFVYENAGSIPGSYAPFSYGPRNCIGHRYAMNEFKVLLAHVVRQFDITPYVEEADLDITSEIIIRCKTPMKMGFTKRKCINSTPYTMSCGS